MQTPGMNAEGKDVARAQEILDALERLVLRHRSLSISFNAIADDVGISRSLLYTYFDSPNAMLDTLFLSHAQGIESRFRPIMSSQASFRDKAVECGKSYFAYCVEAGPLLQLILREAQGDSPLSEESRAYFRKIIRMLASEATAGLKVGAREAFVSLELLAAIPEALARMVRDNQIEEATGIATCERLVGAAIDSLGTSKPV